MSPSPRFGGALDGSQGDGDAVVGGAGALGDLSLGVGAVAAVEALDALGQEVPRLGELGAALGRGEQVAPAHPAVVDLEGELAAGCGHHDLGSGLPGPLGSLVPAGEPGARARPAIVIPPAGLAD